jgi:hypothetical protein
LGIFRYGYALVGKLVILFWFLIVISPVAINIFLLKRLGISRQAIIERVVSLNWVVVTFVGLALYFLLMSVAIKTLKKQYLNGD